MGSEEVWKLEYRDGFAFVGVCGMGAEVREKRAGGGSGESAVSVS